jgi:hypothetical protein
MAKHGMIDRHEPNLYLLLGPCHYLVKISNFPCVVTSSISCSYISYLAMSCSPIAHAQVWRTPVTDRMRIRQTNAVPIQESDEH